MSTYDPLPVVAYSLAGGHQVPQGTLDLILVEIHEGGLRHRTRGITPLPPIGPHGLPGLARSLQRARYPFCARARHPACPLSEGCKRGASVSFSALTLWLSLVN